MGKKTMKTGQNKNKEVNWQVTFLQLQFVRKFKKNILRNRTIGGCDI